MSAPGPRPLRLLIVDDSRASRGELEAMLASAPGIEIAGHAGDGEEALRQALALAPDAILLDLQMPRMDGFTFLRLLMERHPTPVVVLSGASRRGDVFKSLEFGALDFVAKPEEGGLSAVRGELLAKLEVVRALRIENLEPIAARERPPARMAALVEPPRVAVIGASTGGPRALQEILAALPGDLPLGILVAQHMPARFTRAFADRLARTSRLAVAEAADGDLVAAGRVLVAPGGCHLELERAPEPGGTLRAAVRPRDPAAAGDRYCPSVDRLLASAARLLGPRVCAAILTGMGTDGRAGAEAVRAAGGLTLAESERTAVVYGMPGAAVAAGAVDEVLDLQDVAGRLVRFARGA